MKPTSLPRIAATATVLSVLLLMALPKAHAETETVLYSFCSVGEFCNDGEIPNGPLTFGLYGNLYGTTPSGGANGGGAVFGLYPKLRAGAKAGPTRGTAGANSCSTVFVPSPIARTECSPKAIWPFSTGTLEGRGTSTARPSAPVPVSVQVAAQSSRSFPNRFRRRVAPAARTGVTAGVKPCSITSAP